MTRKEVKDYIPQLSQVSVLLYSFALVLININKNVHINCIHKMNATFSLVLIHLMQLLRALVVGMYRKVMSQKR